MMPSQIVILWLSCYSLTSVAFVSLEAARGSRSELFSSAQPQHHQPLSITAASATICARIDRSQAQRVTNKILCPPDEERDRNTAGMQAFDTTVDAYRGNAIKNDDPLTQFTYGEFPFDSFDVLVDRALELRDVNRNNFGKDQRKDNVMVDLGSGSGRLVFYAALTRGCHDEEEQELVSCEENSAFWEFHGIEIGSKLHSLALKSLQRGNDNGWFLFDHNHHQQSPANRDRLIERITFHQGNALLVEDPYFPSRSNSDVIHDSTKSQKSIRSVLSRATLLFAYSTVWETDHFDPNLQAMILSRKWSQTLASLCQDGCVAVTTDRALNPSDGWRLLESMEVKNPSVWGSVGYISVLEK